MLRERRIWRNKDRWGDGTKEVDLGMQDRYRGRRGCGHAKGEKNIEGKKGVEWVEGCGIREGC